MVLTTPRGAIAASAEALDGLQTQLKRLLDRFHEDEPDRPGVGIDDLHHMLDPDLPEAVFQVVLERLMRQGAVVLDRMWVRRPYHRAELSHQDAQLWQLIRPYLQRQLFRPPRVRDIARATGINEGRIRRLLRLVARRGDVEEIAQDHFFLQTAVRKMAQTVVELARQAPQEGFAIASFRDRFGNGRKVSIQILEFFDRHGLTVRRDDLRYVNQARIALFNPRQA